MKHTYHECNEDDCLICYGCLAYCTVCKGGEGSLPTECPGAVMEENVEQAVYSGKLDFVDGEWFDV